MNVAHISEAPQEYLEVVWIADTCKLLMGVGWVANYVGMIYKSFQDKTYGMALMPLCCNIAWESVYAIVYPFSTRLEQCVHLTILAMNCGVMFAAVKFAPNEWGHAPLVQRYIKLIFAICIAGWMSAHLAVAAQLGPSLAQALSAYVCQLLLSVGGLCQLISRGHSRGTSYLLWFSRFFGSLVLIPQDVLRYTYWRKAHEWMSSPLYLWFIAIFLIIDASYGLCLWYVRRHEKEIAEVEKQKKR